MFTLERRLSTTSMLTINIDCWLLVPRFLLCGEGGRHRRACWRLIKWDVQDRAARVDSSRVIKDKDRPNINEIT